MATESALDRLGTRCSESWDNIKRCAEEAIAERQKLENLFSERRLVPSDTCAVVFGSLARNEWTSGSDVDWTLLVDGPVDPAHSAAAEEIQRVLQDEGYKKPGPTGTFGNIVFSHQLVHRIGGDEDSNRNTTQRILLLLESAPLGGAQVRDRVIRQLFKRYVDDDNAYRPPRQRKPFVPHFFLNDVVRYWRTMAVDLVQKLHDRGGNAWALRNFKLRMSRKLLFVAGLTMSLNCKLDPSGSMREDLLSDGDLRSAMTAELVRYADKPPLEILAELALRIDAQEAARAIFGAYDRFLSILSEAGERSHLESLAIDDAPKDELFGRSRAIAKAYQRGLEQLFFESDDELRMAVREYGVF